jgi:hypothetical protein
MDSIIVCLSNNAVQKIASSEKDTKKVAFFQKEIEIALALAKEAKGANFIIPILLEPLGEKKRLPENLKDFQIVKYYERTGYQDLLRALAERSNQLNTVSHPPQAPPVPIPANNANSVPSGQTSVADTTAELPLAPLEKKKLTRRDVIVRLAAAGTGILAVGGTGTTLLIRSCSASSGTTITLAASSEKYNWLKDAINTFQILNKNITVKLQEDGSLSQKKDWLNNSHPTIWSPASQIDVDLFSAAWLQNHQAEDIISLGSLVTSPLIFAIWQQYADVLISKYNSISFASLYDAFRVPDGWASPKFGKNGWGGITFTHTRSDTSNSGLSTLLLIADSDAQSLNRPLTVPLIQQSQDFLTYLKVFEDKAMSGWQMFPNSSGSSATYFDDIISNASGYNIVVTYENLFLHKMLQNPQLKLTMFYPQRDIISDHPFILFKDASTEQQTAAHDFYNYLISSEQQRNAVTYGFRPSHGVNFLDASIDHNPFVNQTWSSSIDRSIRDTFGRQQTSILNELIQGWQNLYGKSS